VNQSNRASPRPGMAGPMDIMGSSRVIHRLRQKEVSVPLLAGVSALIAFVLVILLSKQVVGRSLQPSQTWYAIAMGLLGSSLFLLYNLIGVIPEHRFKAVEVGENLARLFVGPVAGWLSYFMFYRRHHPDLAPVRCRFQLGSDGRNHHTRRACDQVYAGTGQDGAQVSGNSHRHERT